MRTIGYMAIKYYKNLDGLRGVAILMVMFGHFFMTMHSNFYLLESLLRKISILGQLGVTLFFVLSGFLITRILLETKDQKYFFKNFYIRRVLRIFPLYYSFFIIYYLVRPLIFNQSFSNFSEQLPYYLYLQNFAITFNWNAIGPMHFWSLAIEEHFYLFWPLIIFLFNKKHITQIIFAIIILSILLRYYFIENNIDVYYFTFTRMDSLAIGSLIAIIEKGGFKINFDYKQYLLFFSGFSVLTFILWIYLGGDADKSLQIIKYTLFSITFFSFLGLLISLKDNNKMNVLLRNSFLTLTGKISYGLYVYHLFAFEMMNYFYRSNLWYINFVISFSTSYLLAYASFNLFESKFLKLKKHFANEI